MRRRGGAAGEEQAPAAPVSQQQKERQPWAPTTAQAACLLVLVRVLGASYYQLVSDCDETFNYWEPTHFLLYGRGLQTWEYAPQYALRSYAYAGFHAVLGALAGAGWGVDKVFVFQLVRFALAALCGVCEAALYRGVVKAFGPGVGRYTLAGLLASAGMLHAAPAYLPSTFTMYGLAVTWGAWLSGETAAAVWAAVVGLAFGWPFGVVALLPMALHVLLTQCIDWAALALKPAAYALAGHAVAAAVCVLGSQALVDRAFYSTWLIAPWNIIKYNALGQGGDGKGSDLYGVEPASYYARNLALNFNVVAVLATLSPLAVGWATWRRSHGWDKALAAVACLMAWIGAMAPRPHKEERFLFTVYPLLPLAAALSLQALENVTSAALAAVAPSRPWKGTVRRSLLLALTLSAGALSASRIVALVRNFSAPFAVWGALSDHLVDGTRAPLPYAVSTLLHRPSPASAAPGVRVCVGKEWYRFPASFYLPEATRADAAPAAAGYQRVPGGRAELAFLKSGFGGQLPQPFLSPPLLQATAAFRGGFNDVNEEEADRYVLASSCDYIVDFQLPTPRSSQQGAAHEPHFQPGVLLEKGAPCCSPGGPGGKRTAWRSLISHPFLHADSSTPLGRALALPAALGGGHDRVTGRYHALAKEMCVCPDAKE
jgi:alpha-1,2-mannosyltransferase